MPDWAFNLVNRLSACAASRDGVEFGVAQRTHFRLLDGIDCFDLGHCHNLSIHPLHVTGIRLKASPCRTPADTGARSLFSEIDHGRPPQLAASVISVDEPCRKLPPDGAAC
jgi:hypothetical protein